MTHINAWREQETRGFEFQTVFIAKKMKNICKFTVDSDDEVVHIYSVNKDGVVVISDDDDTPVQRQSSGITNVSMKY